MYFMDYKNKIISVDFGSYSGVVKMKLHHLMKKCFIVFLLMITTIVFDMLPIRKKKPKQVFLLFILV